MVAEHNERLRLVTATIAATSSGENCAAAAGTVSLMRRSRSRWSRRRPSIVRNGEHVLHAARVGGAHVLEVRLGMLRHVAGQTVGGKVRAHGLCHQLVLSAPPVHADVGVGGIALRRLVTDGIAGELRQTGAKRKCAQVEDVAAAGTAVTGARRQWLGKCV